MQVPSVLKKYLQMMVTIVPKAELLGGSVNDLIAPLLDFARM